MIECRKGLLEIAYSRGVIAPLACNLEQSGLDRLFSLDERHILSAARQAAVAVQDALHAVFQELMDRVGCYLRDVMVLKGFDLIHSAYPRADLRELRDLDILVHREDIGLVRRALLDAGLMQGVFDRNEQRLVPAPRSEIERIEQAHYECFPFRKFVRIPCLDGLVGSYVLRPNPATCIYLINNEAWYLLEVDIHHHISPDINLEDVWNAQRPLSINSLHVKGQTPEAMLWFIATRLYHEAMLMGNQRLPNLHDITVILHRWVREIDWSMLVQISSRYHFHPSLYYVLMRVSQLFDAPVPGDVLKQLFPVAAGVSRLHDWGDFLPKMLGYCDLPEITFAE